MLEQEPVGIGVADLLARRAGGVAQLENLRVAVGEIHPAAPSSAICRNSSGAASCRQKFIPNGKIPANKMGGTGVPPVAVGRPAKPPRAQT